MLGEYNELSDAYRLLSPKAQAERGDQLLSNAQSYCNFKSPRSEKENKAQLLLSSDIGSTEPSQAKFSKVFSSNKQRGLNKQKYFTKNAYQQFHPKNLIHTSNPPSKLNSSDMSKVIIPSSQITNQELNQIQSSPQRKYSGTAMSYSSKPHSTTYSKPNTGTFINYPQSQIQQQPNLVDILGSSLPPPGSFGSFAGKTEIQKQSRNNNLKNQNIRIGSSRPFTIAGGQRSFTTVSQHQINKNPKFTKSRLNQLLRLCSPAAKYRNTCNKLDVQGNEQVQKAILNPRANRIQNQNFSLNMRFERSSNLSDVTHLQGQIKLNRAKNMAKKTVQRVGKQQQKQQKILSMMQKSNNYADSLFEMSTKFNRTQIAQSNLPYKAFFNQTVDRIKSSQISASQKTIESFIILTPHKSQVKQHIDLMSRGNQKRLRVPLLDRKLISQRAKIRWKKAYAKIVNMLRMKRFGLMGGGDSEKQNMSGFFQAEMAKDHVVQQLSTRFSQHLTPLLKSTQGNEQNLKNMPPIKFVKQKQKFMSVYMDAQARIKEKRDQEERESPWKKDVTKRVKTANRLVSGKKVANKQYRRWWIEPDQMKVLKKQIDILAEYQKQVGKQVALKELRGEQDQQDEVDEQQIKLGYVDTQVLQFKDPLPLRHDPFRFSIQAMQNFVKPLQQEIAQQLRNTKQSQIRNQRSRNPSVDTDDQQQLEDGKIKDGDQQLGNEIKIDNGNDN